MGAGINLFNVLSGAATSGNSETEASNASAADASQPRRSSVRELMRTLSASAAGSPGASAFDD